MLMSNSYKYCQNKRLNINSWFNWKLNVKILRYNKTYTNI